MKDVCWTHAFESAHGEVKLWAAKEREQRTELIRCKLLSTIPDQLYMRSAPSFPHHFFLHKLGPHYDTVLLES